MGWHGTNSGDTTHPVGEKAPNQFGLYDMHGNVLEWCEDTYDWYFYSNPEATELDPLCVMGSGDRVIRGGSFYDIAASCRIRMTPWTRDDSTFGFRAGYWPLP